MLLGFFFENVGLMAKQMYFRTNPGFWGKSRGFQVHLFVAAPFYTYTLYVHIFFDIPMANGNDLKS